MKRITCSDLGGLCDAPITGGTSREMMANWQQHLERAHPDEARERQSMTQEELDIWEDDFQRRWDEVQDL